MGGLDAHEPGWATCTGDRSTVSDFPLDEKNKKPIQREPIETPIYDHL